MQKRVLKVLGLNEAHPEQSIFGPHKVPLRNQKPEGFRESLSPMMRDAYDAQLQLAVAQFHNEILAPAKKYVEEHYQITIKEDPEKGLFLWKM